MRRKEAFLTLLTVTLLCLSGATFGFNFGGGGPSVYYFPGGTFIGTTKNINIPLLELSQFTDGIIAFGGAGYGGVPGGMYSGGFGFGGEKEYTLSGNTYRVSIGGGFGSGMKKIDFGNIAIQATIGFGGFDLSLERKVNDGNTSIGNLEDGTLEGYLGASISYLTLSGSLGLSIQVSFLELSAGAIAFFGYSPDGWLVNGKKLTGLTNDYNFLMTYALYGGVAFGF